MSLYLYAQRRQLSCQIAHLILELSHDGPTINARDSQPSQCYLLNSSEQIYKTNSAH